MEQRLLLDVMHIQSTHFLLGLLEPLGLYLVAYLPDVSAASIAPRVRGFLSKAASRNFVCIQCRSDNDGGIASMRDELQTQGVDVQPCGPGQHVPEIERAIRVVKERVRCHVHGLPFRLTSMFLMMLVCFCVGRINWQRRSGVEIAPAEQFIGRKLDAKLDLRVGFGDYVQATTPNTNNTMDSRTEGCIALLPLGNLAGSVRMFALKTGRLVTRDQFHVLPMPDNVIAHLNQLADLEGIFGSEAEHDEHDQLVDVAENTAAVASEPTFMPVENRTVCAIFWWNKATPWALW